MNLKSIPIELKKLNQFVLWDSSSGRKIPIDVSTGLPAKADDPSTWNSFDACSKFIESHENFGLGFEFSEKDPYCGIDFDHCLDSDLAFKDPSIRAFFLILWKSGTYCEISQSGSGLHVIVKNEIPFEFLKSNRGGRRFGSFCEMYHSFRYFALTGNLYHSRFKESKIKRIESRTWIKCLKILDSGDYSQFLDFSDRFQIDHDPVIDLCNKNSKFASALNGDSSYWDGDESSRDLYVISRLFECLGSRDLVRSYFLKSDVSKDLSRPEHRGHEEDYLNRTLDFAESNFRGSSFQKSKKSQSPSRSDNPPRLDTSADPYDCTDLENGRKLFEICRKSVRFCCKEDQFYRWNFSNRHNRWSPIDIPQLYDYCVLISDSLKEDADRCSSESTKKKYLAGSRLLKMNSHSDRAINRLKSFSEILIEPSDLNSAIHVLPFRNGCLNLVSGEFYDSDPNDLFTACFDVEYDRESVCERWIDFVNEVLPDLSVQREVQKFMGYSLTGDISYEKFLYIYGHGGNGKGTFLSACQSVLGSFASSFPVSLFSLNQYKDGESPNPVLYSLRSKRLIVSDEISASINLNVSQIKSFTGGDRIVARGLRKDPIEFFPQFKVIFVGNEFANFGSINDQGILRRLIFASFDQVPNKIDPNLKKYLSSEECRSGILNWMLEGYSLLKDEGFFESDSMKNSKEIFMSSSDPVSAFLSENCVFDKSLSIKVSDLYSFFKRKTDSQMSRTQFTISVLTDSRVELIRPGNIQKFKGVDLNAEIN